MSNYQESNVSGTAWTRCRLASIINPLGQTPAVVFAEEKIISMGDGTVVARELGTCQKDFSAATSFPLLDPGTGAPTGATATHQDVYALLFSLYMQTAMERDEAQG